MFLQVNGSCNRVSVKKCGTLSFTIVRHVFLIICFCKDSEVQLINHLLSWKSLPYWFGYLLLLPCRPASSFVSFCKLYWLGEREHGRKCACLYQNISPCVSAMFIPKQLLLCFMNIPVRKSSFQLSMVVFPRRAWNAFIKYIDRCNWWYCCVPLGSL